MLMNLYLKSFIEHGILSVNSYLHTHPPHPLNPTGNFETLFWNFTVLLTFSLSLSTTEHSQSVSSLEMENLEFICPDSAPSGCLIILIKNSVLDLRSQGPGLLFSLICIFLASLALLFEDNIHSLPHALPQWEIKVAQLSSMTIRKEHLPIQFCCFYICQTAGLTARE